MLRILILTSALILSLAGCGTESVPVRPTVPAVPTATPGIQCPAGTYPTSDSRACLYPPVYPTVPR